MSFAQAMRRANGTPDPMPYPGIYVCKQDDASFASPYLVQYWIQDCTLFWAKDEADAFDVARRIHEEDKTVWKERML